MNKMKFFLLIFLSACMMPIFAQVGLPLLVLDKNSNNLIPKKFRSTEDQISDNKINLQGFADLHIAGSAQFQAQSLSAIMKRLHIKHMTVVDLREEAHGFLNNQAISWYGMHNAANEGKSAEEIKQIETALLSGLKQHPIATVYKIMAKTDGVIEAAEPISYPVKTALSEASVVHHQQLSYQRFYVQDFHAPSATEAARFVKFVKSLKNDDWLYFHCRGGSGRSTTFMVMFDMLRNAKQVSFADILARHKAIGGKDLTKMPPENSYKYPYAVARLAFLKQFYEQAKSN